MRFFLILHVILVFIIAVTFSVTTKQLANFLLVSIKILFKCFHYLNANFLFFFLIHLLRALDVLERLILAVWDALESVAKYSSLHPAQLQQSLAIVEVRVRALVSRLPMLGGEELAGLGQAVRGAGEVLHQQVPLALQEVVHALKRSLPAGW